jgi:Holliday junction resolvasome RuvABC ATP-dependent DNA helicase subunit
MKNAKAPISERLSEFSGTFKVREGFYVFGQMMRPKNSQANHFLLVGEYLKHGRGNS